VGKEVGEVMHPLRWLYQQSQGETVSGDGVCFLCGESACVGLYAVTKGIADTFNSHYLARCPSSPWLCAACQWYFDSKAGHPDFRKMSLVVSPDSWRNWERTTMKSNIAVWLSSGVPFDCYLVCSLSKKKHILLQAPINAAKTYEITVQVEEQVAYLNLHDWQHMDRSFMRLLELGHGKGEILSGHLYGNTLRKHGQIKEAMHLSGELASYRDSAALGFLSYVTIGEKEEDGTINTPGTGDGISPAGLTATQSGMEPNRCGIQSKVPDGYLDAGREQCGSLRSDDQQPDEVSQHALWEVSGSCSRAGC
jgi:hypothetical protein